ncbi:MAG: TonB-dependent receptor [Acidobacteria bacterium]|nr:TonB-dependent receptor [Acidobacteriota bacterium]
MKHISLVLAVILVLVSAAPAFAQTGSVSGTVADESGGVVPGATVTLSGPAGREVVTSGAQGDYRFENVAPSTYEVTATLTGFAPATAQNIAVGAGNVDVPQLVLTLAQLGETVVVSASKQDSILIDAPATMSVLTSSVIEATPVQSYADLLRGVPGVNVIQLSARDVNLTSRQATSTLSNSQLALLDGRSIYLDFFGLILWDFVPSNSSDIKQIEVIRGPASVVWGANAQTGVVNIITKSPRESVGTTVTFTGGLLSRSAGSTQGKDPGTIFGAHASVAQAPTDVWSYRISAGYFDSEAFPRPVGRIPVIQDPRDPSKMVGGAFYPADRSGAFGTAFPNRGTNQPRFDTRVDQELDGGGRISYNGGVAGTSGIIYTGIGPFDIQPGSTLGYARVSYSKAALKAGFFANFLDGEAPNLLLPDPLTGKALQLDFKTRTFDFEIGNSTALGTRQAFTYGGNVRRNNFDITITPTAKNRTEIGAYLQDEIFVGPMRFAIGGRVDKFGNLDDPVFSPRLAAIYKPQADHTIRFSFNRAFRSPSVVNNYLDIAILTPVNLSGLASLLPPPLRPLVANPFPLVVKAVGSELPIGTVPQEALKEDALTAYEVAYTGSVGRTTLGVAFYVNDSDQNINFSQLSPTLDPYTVANPPPGWQLPPIILAAMAQQGIFLPRTAFTYLNLGPLRQKGLELSIDQQFSRELSAFANYSWQGKPQVLDAPEPYPSDEIAFPPTHRFNAGATYNGRRYLGSLSVNYSDGAFWSDVLTSPFHGFTESYTMVNGSFGVRWMARRLTTSIKSTNVFNQNIQQHVFGDIVKRQVVAEVRISY